MSPVLLLPPLILLLLPPSAGIPSLFHLSWPTLAITFTISSYNLPFSNLTCSSKIHQKLITFLDPFGRNTSCNHVSLSTLFLVLFIDPAASLSVYRSKFTTHLHDFTSTFRFPNVTQSLFKINKFTFDNTPPIATSSPVTTWSVYTPCVYRSKFTIHLTIFSSTFPFPNLMKTLSNNNNNKNDLL